MAIFQVVKGVRTLQVGVTTDAPSTVCQKVGEEELQDNFELARR